MTVIFGHFGLIGAIVATTAVVVVVVVVVRKVIVVITIVRQNMSFGMMVDVTTPTSTYAPSNPSSVVPTSNCGPYLSFGI